MASGQVRRASTIEELEYLILEVLVERYNIQPEAFQMHYQILYRGTKACGLRLILYGPRGIRLSAIWETQTNSVLFYGSDGQRFEKIRLSEAPDLGQLFDRHSRLAA